MTLKMLDPKATMLSYESHAAVQLQLNDAIARARNLVNTLVSQGFIALEENLPNLSARDAEALLFSQRYRVEYTPKALKTPINEEFCRRIVTFYTELESDFSAFNETFAAMRKAKQEGDVEGANAASVEIIQLFNPNFILSSGPDSEMARFLEPVLNAEDGIETDSGNKRRARAWAKSQDIPFATAKELAEKPPEHHAMYFVQELDALFNMLETSGGAGKPSLIGDQLRDVIVGIRSTLRNVYHMTSTRRSVEEPPPGMRR